jgi:Ser/Thr protein kinase RdoA (MazF antagonist)
MARIGTVIRDVYRRPGAELLVGHLEDRYGIDIAGTTELDAGVIRVERCDGPPWVARRFVTGRDPSRVEGDAEVLRFLERQGVPAERCAHPEPVSTLDGRAVLVTTYVEGKPAANTKTVRRNLGALLGRINAMEPEPGPTRRPAGSLHHLPDYEGRPAQDLAAARALLADLEARVDPAHQQLYDSLLALLGNGDSGDGLPEGFLHPDATRSNVIATPEGLVLVDWAGAGTGPRLASLAVLLHSAGPKQVADVLAGYRAHVELTAEELDRVEGVLWIRPLWLACWQCWLAVVSPRVTRGFVPEPEPERIAAIAEQVRAAG